MYPGVTTLSQSPVTGLSLVPGLQVVGVGIGSHMFVNAFSCVPNEQDIGAFGVV